jgi:hypothetical protein
MIELNKKEINNLKVLLGIKEHQGEKLVKAQARAAQGKVKIKIVREAK